MKCSVCPEVDIVRGAVQDRFVYKRKAKTGENYFISYLCHILLFSIQLSADGTCTVRAVGEFQ